MSIDEALWHVCFFTPAPANNPFANIISFTSRREIISYCTLVTYYITGTGIQTPMMNTVNSLILKMIPFQSLMNFDRFEQIHQYWVILIIISILIKNRAKVSDDRNTAQRWELYLGLWQPYMDSRIYVFHYKQHTFYIIYE